ncbi:uncharacterized protein LOC379466 [Xenopus laevis]|uniref:MGC64368 protein n=1 Tax=Xenopus laevis TaxID=8355 RepID=Q7SYZ7_XENLA|nr:uncharacterized protein LOC379466 [Xenopus laevis]AAH54206.1 MGC64368 protein [Xenopus laevis]
MPGDWDSELDSTWEDEEKCAPRRKRRHVWGSPKADLCNYRRGYPDKVEPGSKEMPNLQFYQNKRPFRPGGEYIDTLLSDWTEDYVRLEENHSYIQWLFPLREKGVNPQAVPLTLHEIKAMKADDNVRRRFCEAYRLMLGFYGIELSNEKTGEVVRTTKYWERFNNLNRHRHNNLRITRILKCLGELGYEHFQAPLIQFFLEETLVNEELPNVRRSALDYFMFTVKDRKKRRELVLYAWKHFPDKAGFIWGPRDILSCRAARSSENHISMDKVKVSNGNLGRQRAGEHGVESEKGGERVKAHKDKKRSWRDLLCMAGEKAHSHKPKHNRNK